jgi:hypothetical protein
LRVVLGKPRQNADPPNALGRLRTCCERPRGCCAAKQRYELAPFQLTKLHPLSPNQADSITDWRGSSQGLAAVQDFAPA